MEKNSAKFSEDYYKSLLEIIKMGNYKITDFLLDKKESGILFLRHDIDKSVKYALRMARIEKEFGVHAHYFFLLHTPLYNIMEPETWDMVNEIHQLGHSIGLHCDERRIPDSTGNIDQDVMKDLKWLKQIFEFARPMVSFHNPTDIVIRRKPSSNYFSTYNPEYFPPQMKYISDSNRSFREENTGDKLRKHTWPRVQILIHPVWWFDRETTTELILKKIVKGRLEQIDTYLKYSNDIWSHYRKDNPLL